MLGYVRGNGYRLKYHFTVPHNYTKHMVCLSAHFLQSDVWHVQTGLMLTKLIGLMTEIRDISKALKAVSK